MIHKHFKADLLVVHNALDIKISEVLNSQRKLLTTSESLSKSTKNLRFAMKELKGKVTKVNDTMDKIANTTSTYHNALMARPANLIRSNADPKVLNDLNRRARCYAQTMCIDVDS